MNYTKPQSPMYLGSTYIYPLTTTDQIVKSDGTRLKESDLVGGFYGIDPKKVISSGDVKPGTTPIPVLEDGWLYISYSDTNEGTDSVLLDNMQIQPANANTIYRGWYPVKKGQTISASYKDVRIRYTIYGLNK